MNRLYPLKFKPIIKDKIWGGTRLKNILNKKTKNDKAGESWEISAYPGSISKVANGFLAGNSLPEIIEVYMGDIVGDAVFDRFGTLFPLLIKFIDANDMLSVQVHPDDELALKQFQSFGKTEMWYIIEAESDSEITVGFNRPVNAELYKEHLQKGSLINILNKEKTRHGDVFFLPAGRIHAIGKGILLAEIQQTSDATLRIYDYDRLDDQGKPRELHTDMALEAIDFNPVKEFKTSYEKKPDYPNRIASCDYFTVNCLHLNKALERDYHNLDSFVIFMCIEGDCTVEYYKTEKEKVSKGETVLIPAEIKNIRLIPDKPVELLEIYIEGALLNNTDELIDRLLL